MPGRAEYHLMVLMKSGTSVKPLVTRKVTFSLRQKNRLSQSDTCNCHSGNNNKKKKRKKVFCLISTSQF